MSYRKLWAMWTVLVPVHRCLEISHRPEILSVYTYEHYLWEMTDSSTDIVWLKVVSISRQFHFKLVFDYRRENIRTLKKAIGTTMSTRISISIYESHWLLRITALFPSLRCPDALYIKQPPAEKLVRMLRTRSKGGKEKLLQDSLLQDSKYIINMLD